MVLWTHPPNISRFELSYQNVSAGSSATITPIEDTSKGVTKLQTIDGLESGSEYAFAIRQHGDGSRYVNAPSAWASENARTVYPMPSKPGRNSACRLGLYTYLPDMHDSDQATESGYTHTASMTAYRAYSSRNWNLGCMYAVVGNKSTASTGMDNSYWKGGIINAGPLSISPSDISEDDIGTLSVARFVSLYDPPSAPSRSFSGQSDRCTRCKGGYVRTPAQFIPFDTILKRQVWYAYGEHTFTRGNWTKTMTTSYNWTKPAQEISILPPNRNYPLPITYMTFKQYWDKVEGEIRQDLGSILASKIATRLKVFGGVLP